jgi:hypothetical protein
MIYGNSRQQSLFLDLLRSGTQVLCLSGDPHIGKSSFLREELPSMASDQDLMFASSGPNGAREARDFAFVEPVHGDFRILAVEDASSLSEPAQDAYLKLLEEPPPSLRIVVTTSDDGLLHPAMRSRLSRVIRWSPLSVPDMDLFVSTIEPPDHDLARIVRGRPGLYSLTHSKSYYKDLFAFVVDSISGSVDPFQSPVPDAIEKISNPDDRSVVSHLCRFAALSSAGRPESVKAVLSFCSTLSSSVSVSPSTRWVRAAARMSVSL